MLIGTRPQLAYEKLLGKLDHSLNQENMGLTRVIKVEYSMKPWPSKIFRTPLFIYLLLLFFFIVLW